MRKLYLTLLFLMVGLMATAQNISVADFYLAENDLTARTHGTSVEDQNGNLCALIKVETTEKGMWAFDVGMMGVTKTEMQNAVHPAEIWVYIPFGINWITIQHDQLGKLTRYNFPCSIDKGCTYVMKLTTAKVKTIVEETVSQQYLAFQISPAHATLEVNDQIWEVDADGNAQDFVKFGSYSYRVQAANYHPAVGKVTVNDPNNTQFVKVTLDPNFGWIEVSSTGELQGASVYVDNTLIGKAPCKSEAMKSGQHTVRIAKKMYATYSETVTVKDNETTRLAPSLAADFAEITLKVNADAEIWVNNEKKGTRTWTGPLGSGTYKMECKLANHETSTTTMEITASMNGQTITLPAPTPIYGSLMVESTPKFCKLYIDGKDMGTTPKSINEILIGQHEIRLTQDGYADYTETVTITQGERKQVKATLSNGKEIQFSCNVPDAQLEIDGQRVGTATGTYQLTYGSHSLLATAADYQDYTATISVTESSSSHSIQMKAINNSPEGASSGKFSVGTSKKVYFAKGNLQYQASTCSWRFAEHQWDCIGDGNKNISSSYSGWIDLFGWGTGNNPTKTSTNNSDYASFSDWGDKIGGGWRTLTKDEWEYVFDRRRTTSGIRYAKAMVNNVNGVILLPDDWSTATYKLSKTNTSDADYNSNSISSSTWNSTFAPAGAVFLPAAGLRSGTSVNGVGTGGYYWSASYNLSGRAYYVLFSSGSLLPTDDSGRYRCNGRSVRLVASAEN